MSKVIFCLFVYVSRFSMFLQHFSAVKKLSSSQNNARRVNLRVQKKELDFLKLICILDKWLLTITKCKDQIEHWQTRYRLSHDHRNGSACNFYEGKKNVEYWVSPGRPRGKCQVVRPFRHSSISPRPALPHGNPRQQIREERGSCVCPRAEDRFLR